MLRALADQPCQFCRAQVHLKVDRGGGKKKKKSLVSLYVTASDAMDRRPLWDMHGKKNTACDNLLLFPLRHAQTLSWASRSSLGVRLFSLRAKRPRQVWQWMWLCWHGRVKGFGKTVFCNLVTTARCAASPVVVCVRELDPFFFYLRPSPLKIYYPL